MPEYYDGTKLLSMKDLNGNTPEIFIATTNRTGGKTTYFGRLAVNRFKSGKGKFMLIYRFIYELDDCADKFFKDVGNLFFKKDTMESKRRANGIYHELFLNGVSCGYAVALNSADQIKKNSHLFSDTSMMLFDEFQSESNHYCDNEVSKFMSVHTSVARGIGEQAKYLPVFMLSNPVSIINPYYVAMDISSRLNDNVKFLRGNGFVLEQGYLESASKAQLESGFNKAFGKSSYVAYASQCVYLNDNKAFIEKPSGKGKYLATLRYNGCEYAIREYIEDGVLYCDDKVDKTFKMKISVTTDDHNVNYVMLKAYDFFLTNLRYYFDMGCFRFKDLRCKECVLKALSY